MRRGVGIVVGAVSSMFACQVFLDVERSDAAAPIDAAAFDARDEAVDVDTRGDVAADANGGVETLVTRGVALESLIVDKTHAYWVEPGTSGSVMRCAIAKCEPEVVAGAQADPVQVVFFATTVAWITRANSWVWASVDGEPKLLTGALETSSLAAFGPNVYYNFRAAVGGPQGSIASCTLDSCSGASVIATYEDAMPEQLRATTGGLAWILFGNRLRACEDCGASQGIRNVVTSDVDGIATFTSDKDFFYIARSSGKGGIYTMPAVGIGAPVELVSGGTDIRSLAVDGSHLFYAQRLTGDVRWVARTGGPSNLLAARGASTPQSLAVQGDYVYWVEGPSIVRMRKP